MITPASAQALLEKISRLRVLVIGDIMLDHYIWGDASRISPEAPVPVVDIARDSHTAGGAANVALNIASLGARSTVAGYLGDDESGRLLRQLLAEARIDAIPTPGTGATIVKTRVMVRNQQLCRLDREGAASGYAIPADQIETLLAAAVATHDAIILSDYAKGVITEDVVRFVHDAARKAGKFVALDPKPRRLLAFQDMDLITPNRREALQLAGMEPLAHTAFPAEEVCRRLHERHGTRNVVITLSEDGMLLSRDGAILTTIPTAARAVFDVSGAGDTALASLTLALAAGATLEDAAHFANAASGVVVAKVGTATVTAPELLAYLHT